MIKKRFVTMVMAIAMVFSGFPTSSYAQIGSEEATISAPASVEGKEKKEDNEETASVMEVKAEDAEDVDYELMADGGEVTWNLDDFGTLTISGHGRMEDYSDVDKVPWYQKRDRITSVIIEEKILSIGSNAFRGCTNLVDVHIPNSITDIGDFAFSGCYSLTDAIIPDSVTNIGAWAFWGCHSLTSVNIPDGVNKIKYASFADCPSLVNVHIPNNVTSIEAFAFESCTSLTSINLPNDITTINVNTFYGCKSLSNVLLSKNITSIDEKAFYKCYALSDIYYNGSEKDWSAISIWKGNDSLISSNIHYNYMNNSIINGYLKYNGHTYKVYPGDTVGTFPDAINYCEEKNGHLAVISSEQENDAIYNYICNLGHPSAYFGLSDEKSEGNWEWVTETDNTYTNWHSGEPNAGTSKEDYAMFYYKYTNGQWNDGAFDVGSALHDINAFICEWDYDYDQDPGRSPTDNNKIDLSEIEVAKYDEASGNTDFDYDALYVNDRCYLSIEVVVDKDMYPRFSTSNWTCDSDKMVSFESVSVVGPLDFEEEGRKKYIVSAYGGLNSTGNYEVSFVYDEKKTTKTITVLGNVFFEIGRDNNSFSHNENTFFSTDEKHKLYISKFYFNQLLNRASMVEKSALLLKRNSKWEGACFGLAALMSVANLGKANDITNGRNFSLLSEPKDRTNEPFLRDTLHYYHLLQHIAKASNTLKRGDSNNKLKLFLSGLVREAQEAQKNRKPFVLTYQYNLARYLKKEDMNVLKKSFGNFDGKGGHAVVVCGYRYDSSSADHYVHQLTICDPNKSYRSYCLYVSEDNSSFHFQDSNMDFETSLLTSGRGVNLENVYTSISLYTTEYIEEEADKRIPVAQEEASSSQSLAGGLKESFTDGHMQLLLTSQEPFVLTNEKGEFFSFDGDKYENTMNLYDVSFVDGFVGQMIITTDYSETLHVSGIDSCDFKILAGFGDRVQYVETENASTFDMSVNDGINISGNNYSFTVASNIDRNGDELVKVSGLTDGICRIKPNVTSFEISARNGYSNLVAEKISQDSEELLQAINEDGVSASIGFESTQSPVEEFVSRLYQNFLGREPDVNGLKNWTDLLVTKQTTGAKVIYGFVYSPEFQNNPLSNEVFVTAMYNTIFGRNPDASGLNAWVTVLENGCTRKKVLAGFLNSDEMEELCDSLGILAGSYKSNEIVDQNTKVTYFVSRMYRYCLGREADASGLTSWVSALLEGRATGTKIATGFFSSPEMKQMNLTNYDFVVNAYVTLLDRQPDEKGLSAWVRALDSSGDRSKIVRGFTKSEEFGNLCAEYGIAR